MKNMAHRLIDDVLVVVHSARMPTGEEWRRYMDFALRAADQQTELPFFRQLVMTDGGRPSVRQQLSTVRRVRGRGVEHVPVGVVSSKWAVRMIVRLARQNRMNVHVYTPERIAHAIAWLSIDVRRASRLSATLRDLAAEVGGCATVDLACAALDQVIETQSLDVQLEKERRRIARDLHDGLGNELAGLFMRLQIMTHGASGAEKKELTDLAARVGDATEALRGIVWALRSDDRKFQEVSAYIRTRIGELNAQGLPCRFEAMGDDSVLIPGPIALHVLRVVQEGLGNTLRHADAKSASIGLQCARDRLVVRIDDDGRGIPESELDAPRGGLRNIRTRVESLGGTAQLDTDHTGTRWHLEIPLRAESCTNTE